MYNGFFYYSRICLAGLVVLFSVPFFASAIVDENNNGLDDVWEMYYDAFGVSPGGDEDRDTKSNLQESRAGTDPFDPNDSLRVEKFVKDGETGTVSFVTKEGKLYKVYRTANLEFANWAQDGGDVTGDGSQIDHAVAGLTGSSAFFRIGVNDNDADNDGLSDWAESLLDGFDPDNDFSSDPLVSDRDAFLALLASVGGPSEVSLEITEAEAFEKFGDGGPQSGKVVVSRTGSMGALTVFLDISGDAGAADFTLKDANGAAVAGFCQFGFGESSKELFVEPIVDSVGDYPRTLSVALAAHADYSLGVATSGDVDIFDGNNALENQQLFYGQVRPERGAATSGSGYATIRLNGKRTQALVDFRFSGLSSNQSAAHIHQSRDDGGGTITNGPVVESLPLGNLDDYVWDVVATGAYTGQDLIDSLYGQNGRFPLYVNAHTANAPGGEIWAFFAPYNGNGNFEPPSDPPPVSDLSGVDLKRDVVRFLTQATFGARQEDVDALVASVENDHGGDQIAAYDEWIDDQFAETQTSLHDLAFAMDAEEWSLNGNNPIDGGNPQPFQSNRRSAWWSLAVAGKDQLRQRLGLALLELLVISDDNATIRSRHYGAATYADMLAGHADGSYRDILVDVSKSPMMGKYLTHLQNRKATFSNGEQVTSPDENYAREIMQLFSIGLVHLNPDGSLKLDENGEPIPTYGNEDITELARVLTGWSFSKRVGDKGDGYPTQNNTSFTYYGGPLYFQAAWMNPMQNFSSYHDTNAKTVLGQNIAAGLNGEQDLQAAITILFNHENLAPFVARRLIQRLVTSNPSSGYLYRVSQALAGANGGTRGDLKAAVKALLLDHEARTLSLADDISYGKQKEPLVRYVQLLRTLNGRSQLLLSDLAGHGLSAAQIAAFEADATQHRYYDTTGSLGQSPLSAPSVFNWFLPDYVLGGPLANNGLVVPEFTITSESQVVQAVNYNYSTIFSTTGIGGRPRYGHSGTELEHRTLLGWADVMEELRLAYEAASGTAAEKELAAAEEILDKYDLLLTAGTLKARFDGAAEPNPRSAILEVITGVWNGADTNPESTSLREAARNILYQITSSPDYIIQR